MICREIIDTIEKRYPKECAMATGIQDFWRRWHISLTSWFTEYLYFPLGGSRKGTFRRYVNIMIVFLVSGLWPGRIRPGSR